MATSWCCFSISSVTEAISSAKRRPLSRMPVFSPPGKASHMRPSIYTSSIMFTRECAMLQSAFVTASSFSSRNSLISFRLRSCFGDRPSGSRG